MPRLAHGVKMVALMFSRFLGNRPFHKAKKKVLFLTIGPPMLSVYSFTFRHGRVAGSGWTRLLAQVFGSRALFCAFHTAAPRNRLVPERV
jgi:hypothetical protein